MNEYPCVSVIVPVYNTSRYLEDCINSICSQKYTNLEIILVNDGSTDNSGDICDKYSQIDDRIKVYHKTNGGLSSARNTGIDVSNGEYIAFVDSDDWISEWMIFDMVTNMIKTNADISICGFNKTTKRESADVLLNKYEIMNTNEAFLAMYKYSKYSSEACNKIYKKYLFDNIRYPIGKIFEDQLTTYKLINNASTIIYTTSKFYFYFMHQESIVHKKFDASYFARITGLDEAIKFFEKNKTILPYIKKQWAISYVHILLKAIYDDYNDFSWFESNKGKLINYSKKCTLIYKVIICLILFNFKLFRKMVMIYHNSRRKKHEDLNSNSML
jgi:glycosyltransferase involved in cell wall biosynthesis